MEMAFNARHEIFLQFIWCSFAHRLMVYQSFDSSSCSILASNWSYIFSFASTVSASCRSASEYVLGRAIV